MTYVGSGKYVEKQIATDWGVLFEANRSLDECIIRNAKKYQGTVREEFLRVAKAIKGDDGVIGYVVAVIDSDNIDYILKYYLFSKHSVQDRQASLLSSLSVRHQAAL